MNKFWKRALCAVLTASFAIGALTGCGGGDKKAAGTSQPAAGQKVKINFPTASASGALYAVGAAITNNWNKNVPGVQASSQASAGGIANLNMVSDGEAQVSIAISSNVSQCLNGTDSFKGHAYKDLKAIAGLYLNPNQVVVTNKSGIKTLADVKGKHFAVASAGSSVYNEAKAHFTAAGLNFPNDFKAEYIAFGGAADMLQNGTLDGAWIMSGAPASAVSQALTANCSLLNIGDDVFTKLKAQYPWYVKYTIPAGTYPNQKDPVQTTAVKMVMFCRGDLPEDTVYQMTKAFWEHIEDLGKSQKNLKGLKPADAVKDIANVPLHPGAAKYYKEIGVLK
ncbi:MAG: TAXI family TRAP transporter solute-binding subunit [Succiniclasticum sp.]|jgi:TRAP transporter TAXI family solute receptor|nr:TAXI family TRAP transporter solute-binding subunit [Succiniclasticum sp.]MEE3479562.1 TAXI family TRAP transporter solute-binding subunit [Succiniclasticum sp.]